MCVFSHIFFHGFVPFFSMTMPYTVLWVIFRFCLLFMDSFRSSRWPSLSSFFRSCPAPVFFFSRLFFHVFVPFFSMTMPYTVLWVIFRFWLLFMDSFRSSRWPSLSFFRSCPAPVFPIYDPFLFRLCVRFLIYVMIVLFSVRSVLCPVYMYCVCIDIACPHFFVHVRLRSFGSMTPPFILTIPVLFHIILCCFRSNFGSSVLCPVYMYCVLYLAFLHVAICCLARLLSFCPGYVFRPVFYSTNATFFVELVPKQSSRHSVSTISSALFCSLSWHSFYSTYY